MVAGGFSQLELEKRLSQLKDSADSVQSLSSWCLKHKHQHRRIVTSWLKVLKRAKIQQRLSLFYLANDVVQHSKRKQLDFVGSFQLVLETAMPLVRDEKLRPAINRILKIWRDRAIFGEAFIATLTNMVTNVGKADSEENAKLLSDFQPGELVRMIGRMETVQSETDVRLGDVKNCQFHVSDTAIDDVRANVKSRAHSNEFIGQLECSVQAMERYVAALDCEIQLRADLVEWLERSELYYETQRTDAKVVAVAYKNFGRRVRELKRKLTETMEHLDAPSPLPSPPSLDDAPSPTGSCEDMLSLPGCESAVEMSDVNDKSIGHTAAADAVNGETVDVRCEMGRVINQWTSAAAAAASSSTSQHSVDVDDVDDVTPPAVSPPSPSPSPPLIPSHAVQCVPHVDTTSAFSAPDYVDSPAVNRDVSQQQLQSLRLADLIPALRDPTALSASFGPSLGSAGGSSAESSGDATSSRHLFPEQPATVDMRQLTARLLGNSMSPPTPASAASNVCDAYSPPTTSNGSGDCQQHQHSDEGKQQQDEDDYEEDDDCDGSHLSSLVRMLDAKLKAKQQQQHATRSSEDAPAGVASVAAAVTQEDSSMQFGARPSGVAAAAALVAIPGLDLTRPPPSFLTASAPVVPPPQPPLPLVHPWMPAHPPPLQGPPPPPPPVPALLHSQVPANASGDGVCGTEDEHDQLRRRQWDRSVDEFISQISGERRQAVRHTLCESPRRQRQLSPDSDASDAHDDVQHSSSKRSRRKSADVMKEATTLAAVEQHRSSLTDYRVDDDNVQDDGGQDVAAVVAMCPAPSVMSSAYSGGGGDASALVAETSALASAAAASSTATAIHSLCDSDKHTSQTDTAIETAASADAVIDAALPSLEHDEQASSHEPDNCGSVKSPQSAEQLQQLDRVVFVPSFGVFRHIKVEPPDDACEAGNNKENVAATAGTSASAGNETGGLAALGPLPPPLTVRLLSQSDECRHKPDDDDAQLDSDTPQVVAVGRSPRTPPPLVDVPDDPASARKSRTTAVKDDWLPLLSDDEHGHRRHRRRRHERDRHSRRDDRSNHRRRHRSSRSASSSSASSRANSDASGRHRRREHRRSVEHRRHHRDDDSCEDRRERRERRRSRSRGRSRSRDRRGSKEETDRRRDNHRRSRHRRRRSASRSDEHHRHHHRRRRSASDARRSCDKNNDDEERRRLRRKRRREQRRSRRHRHDDSNETDGSSGGERGGRRRPRRHNDTQSSAAAPDTAVFDYSQVGAGASRRSSDSSHRRR